MDEKAWMLLILAQIIIGGVLAEKPLPKNVPFLQLDFYHIKTPQLIGIILGCIVFTVTVSTVIYLLYASGTLGRAFTEIAGEASKATPGQSQASSKSQSPQFAGEYELYEHLLKARKLLPIKPHVAEAVGELVIIRTLNFDLHADELYQCCNGQAIFHESSYDPMRIWGWLQVAYDVENSQAPWSSLDNFTGYLKSFPTNSSHIIIIDKEFKRAIGLISLVDNDVPNLSIRVGNIWITPAFQGTKRSHQALVLVIKQLVDSGYRRITFEVDERHIIARKFFQRCGFLHEATLRKHRIINSRNSSSAVYVMLNSDWSSIESKLYKTVGLKPSDAKIKVAALPTAIDKSALVSSTLKNGENGMNNIGLKKKKNKKNKKNK
eukprot:gene35309-42784_t